MEEKEFERAMLQYEQQKKTNKLVGSQYALDVCENLWMQSLCVVSRADKFCKGLADLYSRDLA